MEYTVIAKDRNAPETVKRCRLPKDIDSFYAPVPAKLIGKVTHGACLLYGTLYALAQIESYCWARNSYFCDLFGCKERTLQRWLGALQEVGWIDVEIERSKKGTRRRIYPKQKVGGCHKWRAGGAKNGGPKYSTSVNNTNTFTSLHSVKGRERPGTRVEGEHEPEKGNPKPTVEAKPEPPENYARAGEHAAMNQLQRCENKGAENYLLACVFRDLFNPDGEPRENIGRVCRLRNTLKGHTVQGQTLGDTEAARVLLSSFYHLAQNPQFEHSNLNGYMDELPDRALNYLTKTISNRTDEQEEIHQAVESARAFFNE